MHLFLACCLYKRRPPMVNALAAVDLLCAVEVQQRTACVFRDEEVVVKKNWPGAKKKSRKDLDNLVIATCWSAVW